MSVIHVLAKMHMNPIMLVAPLLKPQEPVRTELTFILINQQDEEMTRLGNRLVRVGAFSL